MGEYEKEFIDVAFQGLDEGIIFLDKNLNIIKINKKICKLLNKKNSNILNTNINNILIESDLIYSSIKDKKNYINKECEFICDSERIRCIINICPVIIEEKAVGVVLSIRDTRKIHKIVNNVVGYKANYKFKDIITQDANMKLLIQNSKKVANTNCSVLIEGASGTGKELFAQAIHNYSKRRYEPFVAINCAAIPRELIESELFGYEKGAFTGANKGGYPGKFELAEGGTIFLDEIGELSLELQSKLLRVLDNHKILRVGGKYEKKIDVKVISATNKDLLVAIERKNFRQDLYYRLNVINIRIPPLEERKKDIEVIAKYFIEKLNKKHSTRKVISERYINKLNKYNWPGNVRELRNLIERSYYLCEKNIIDDDEYINKNFIYNKNINEDIDKNVSNTILPMDELERLNIENALQFFNGNVDEAAKALNMSRATLYRRINKYNLK